MEYWIQGRGVVIPGLTFSPREAWRQRIIATHAKGGEMEEGYGIWFWYYVRIIHHGFVLFDYMSEQGWISTGF